MAATGIRFMTETATETQPAPKFKVGMPAAPSPSSEKWSCRDLRGTIAEAVDRFKKYQPLSEADLKANKKPDANIRGIIPDEDRAWIIRKIQAKAAEGFCGVIVDVHDHAPAGKEDAGSWHISKLY